MEKLAKQEEKKMKVNDRYRKTNAKSKVLIVGYSQNKQHKATKYIPTCKMYPTFLENIRFPINCLLN